MSEQVSHDVSRAITDEASYSSLRHDHIQYDLTDQLFQQWWFLRDNETGYHSFTRLAFDNGTEGLDLGNVQELRQVVGAYKNLDRV